jgi:hypothetical protein
MFNGSTSVSKELWIDSLQGSVPLSSGSDNAVSMSLSVLVVVGMVLALCHDI